MSELGAEDVLAEKLFTVALPRAARAAAVFASVFLLPISLPHLASAKIGLAGFIAILMSINATRWIGTAALACLAAVALVPPDVFELMHKALTRLAI